MRLHLAYVAMHDKDRDFIGARNAKLMIFPGSPLAKKRPKRMMAAELVETSRLFARYVARIEPHWLEPLAHHLSKSHLSEPYWSAKKGAAMAIEKITLFGLPIVAQRRIVISQREPQIARELLIREALVNGFTRMKYEFLQHNQAQVDVVVESEQKTRRRDLLVGEDVLVDFYQERIPQHVVSEASMRKWLQKLTDTSILKFDAAMLWHNEISSNALLAYPDTWQQGALTLPLTYVFSPNSEDDGVTVHIPLALLNQVTLNGFEWLVPGLRHELLVTLIKSLQTLKT